METMTAKTVTAVPANTGVREFGMRPWGGADRAHTGDLAVYRGTGVSAAAHVARVMELVGDTGAPITGDVRPHLEAPPG
ncbi:MAG: hypothetical protein ACRCY8_03955 [Dermatophilaceae bacterium]